MNESESGQTSGPADDWPFEQPDQEHGYPDLGTGSPDGSAQPYVEWHHDGTAHGEPGLWGYPQDMAPPVEWPGNATYVPEPDRAPGPHGSYEPGPRRPARHRRARRFPWRPVTITALLAAAVAVVTVITFPHDGIGNPAGSPGARATSGTGVMARGGQSPSGQGPTITMKQAEQVVSNYWEVNNKANEQRSDTLLATIKAGSSYSMDVGAYRFNRASNPSGAGYVPFAAAHTAYYIPWQPASAAYPHWFAVTVDYADLASPHHSAGSGYLVFSQASPDAGWKDVVEPRTVAGSGPAPQIATDANGYAIQVSGTAGWLSTSPGTIGLLTASALDNPRTAAIKVPGDLADELDRAYWHCRLPAGSTDVDKHQAGTGPVFGLRTKDGGAVLFYSVDAQLTLAPPSGQTFELDIPGYYPYSQNLTSAYVGYVEQYAAYDPPRGQAEPDVVAEASSIAVRD